MMKRILVTGSRDWEDEDKVWGELMLAYYEFPGEHVVIVHGDCPTGADHLADLFALYHEDIVDVERHPADWEQYGKDAGFRRNQEMVDLGANLCLAFINPCRKCPLLPGPQTIGYGTTGHGSHGASHCANRAEEAGITVWRYRT